MYTIAQIEQVAVQVFAAVTDPEDPPSKLRMKTITDVYFTMLANNSKSIDEDSLDGGAALLVSHFVHGEGARAMHAPPTGAALGLV